MAQDALTEVKANLIDCNTPHRTARVFSAQRDVWFHRSACVYMTLRGLHSFVSCPPRERADHSARSIGAPMQWLCCMPVD